jgi:hypothetical protein
LAIQLAQELRAKLKPPLETSTDNTARTEEDIKQLLEKKKKIEEATKEKNKEGKEYINYATIKDEKEFFNTPNPPKPKPSKFGKKRSYGVSRRRDRRSYSKKRSAKRRTIKKKSIRKKPRAF